MTTSTNQSANARPWDYTPSQGVNSFMMRLLRMPILHRMLSKEILILSYNGRKSGTTFTLPIGYTRDGDTIILLTKRFRNWWKNFTQPLDATLRIEGKDYTVQMQAYLDEQQAIPIIMRVLEAHPRDAQVYGVRMENGKPNPDDVRGIAPKLVVLKGNIR